MAGEDQERFEDYLELERYIEDLQAGRVTHPPEGLTPDQARIYRMATLFHSASSDEAAPRPEFVAELQAKLAKEVGAIDQTPAKEPQKRPRVSRRSLLKGGAAAAAVPPHRWQLGLASITPRKSRNSRQLLPTPAGRPWSLIIFLLNGSTSQRWTNWETRPCVSPRMDWSDTWFATLAKAAIRPAVRSSPCPPPAPIWVALSTGTARTARSIAPVTVASSPPMDRLITPLPPCAISRPCLP